MRKKIIAMLVGGGLLAAPLTSLIDWSGGEAAAVTGQEVAA